MSNMFKEDQTVKHRIASRVEAFRAVLKQRGLDGFIVPNTDEHQGEYTAPYRERLAWLSGFKGTAGLLIVLRDEAALFVDGRYILQAKATLDPGVISVYLAQEVSPFTWLETHAKGLKVIGFDPWTLTKRDMLRYRETLSLINVEFSPSDDNPIDIIWQNQPKLSLSYANVHPLNYAGQSFEEKLEHLQQTLKKEHVDAYATSYLECIAWLLNIRGKDFDVFPVIISHLIVPKEGAAQLYVNQKKLTPDVLNHWGSRVEVYPYEAFIPALHSLGALNQHVWIDPMTNSVKQVLSLEQSGGVVIEKPDPCLLPKARKNLVEVEGARAAHLRDGVALVNFLAWLSREVPKGGVDELKAVSHVLAYRKEQPLFQSVSFNTISSAGPNGAIVHYRVTEETNRPITPHDIYLVDSGGQYLDGTTDVTRTMCFKTPSKEQKDHFTRVLKGHIALARALFPRGTTGSQLDCLARRALWEVGLDYAHGTGHGVGSYLGVHEGPQRISSGGYDCPLELGMILSNEPGYYKTGEYGIRIENLMVVREADWLPLAEKKMYAFETLTLAPIDLELVEKGLMNDSEIAWLNAYHQRVRTALMPLVREETRPWLEKATQPL